MPRIGVSGVTSDRQGGPDMNGVESKCSVYQRYNPLALLSALTTLMHGARSVKRHRDFFQKMGGWHVQRDAVIKHHEE